MHPQPRIITIGSRSARAPPARRTIGAGPPRNRARPAVCMIFKKKWGGDGLDEQGGGVDTHTYPSKHHSPLPCPPPRSTTRTSPWLHWDPRRQCARAGPCRCRGGGGRPCRCSRSPCTASNNSCTSWWARRRRQLKTTRTIRRRMHAGVGGVDGGGGGGRRRKRRMPGPRRPCWVGGSQLVLLRLLRMSAAPPSLAAAPPGPRPPISAETTADVPVFVLLWMMLLPWLPWLLRSMCGFGRFGLGRTMSKPVKKRCSSATAKATATASATPGTVLRVTAD